MSTTGKITIRRYGERVGDYQLVSGWVEAHNGFALSETLLPALGVVAALDGEDCAALWLQMDNSIGVCALEFAVTRPGQTVARSRVALAACADFLEREARGLGYGFCVVHAPEAIARHMEHCGFERRAENMVMLTRRID